MIEIIKSHNRLNGLRFSVAEFALIALSIGVFATYYLAHRRFAHAFIAWGITLNCCPVVALGLSALRNKETAGGLSGSIWDKRAREHLVSENPHMLRDTIVLTVATLLPYVVLVTTLYEYVTSKLVRKG
jgi:hypothetical protein